MESIGFFKLFLIVTGIILFWKIAAGILEMISAFFMMLSLRLAAGKEMNKVLDQVDSMI